MVWSPDSGGTLARRTFRTRIEVLHRHRLRHRRLVNPTRAATNPELTFAADHPLDVDRTRKDKVVVDAPWTVEWKKTKR